MSQCVPTMAAKMAVAVKGYTVAKVLLRLYAAATVRPLHVVAVVVAAADHFHRRFLFSRSAIIIYSRYTLCPCSVTYWVRA